MRMEKPANCWRIPFAAMMIASVFCFDAPQNHLIAAAIAAISLLALAGFWLLDPSLNRNTLTAGFMLFFIALAISLPVAMHYGTPLFDWSLRGAAPLSFLAAFFFIRIKSPDDASYVARVTLAACAVWICLVTWDLSAAYRLLPIHRWALHSDSLLLPYNLAGIAIIIFCGRVASDRIAFPLLFALFLLTVGGGYRSHMILVGAMILGYAALVLHRRNDAKRLASIVATALLAIFAFAAIGLFEAAAKSDDGGVSSCAVSGQRAVRRGPFNIPTGPVAGDTGRSLENRFAIEKFLESPVFGKGLSYAVPSNLIFSGQEDYLRCLETIHGKKYPFVYYTHNLAAYIAMTMGMIGITAALLIIAGAVSSLGRNRIAALDQRIAALAALTALGLFSLVSAAYTVPQTNLLIASFAAILAAQIPGTSMKKSPDSGFPASNPV
jgi:hypothetical protein